MNRIIILKSLFTISLLQSRLMVFLFIYYLCVTTAAMAQAVVFERTYNLGFGETGMVVLQNPDRGYVIGGMDVVNMGTIRAFFFVTDSLGNLSYHRSFGRNNHENQIASAIIYQDSMLFLIGRSSEYTPDMQLVVWKYTLNGDSISTWHYGGNDLEFGMGISEAANNGFIVCGGSYGANFTDVLVIRLDTAGNTLWSRSFGGPDVDLATAVKPTPDHGFIVSGYSFSNFASNGPTAFLWKLDSAGNTQWLKYYGQESYLGWGFDVVVKPGGGFVLGGVTGHYEPENNLWRNVPYLVSTDAEGDTLWTWRSGYPREGAIYSIVLKGEEIWAAGDWLNRQDDNRNMLLSRFSSSGQQLGYIPYGGNGQEVGRDLISTSDGGFAITGNSNSSCNACVYLVKTDSNGCVLPGCVQPVGLQPGQATQLGFKLYPNPARDRIMLETEAEFGELSVEISDLQGRVLHREMQAALPQHTLQLEHLSPGIYLLRIQQNNRSGWARFVKE